ncbi:MAG: OadG family protein [Treponemataceae bacterium]|nr:OadG family protein [Treponemataceae bacterium]
MTITTMLGQSALLTGLGMGVVFTFLIIMILCMELTHKVIHAMGLDKEEPAKKAGPAKPAANQNQAAVVAAIAAAVHDKQLN